MLKFKLIYAISLWLGLIVVSEVRGEVCDKLSKMPWKKYDVTPVPKIAGIYAIGQKIGSKETEYLYIGRSNDVKRRLQEHRAPTPKQAIDKIVAGKFTQDKQSELRIKYVSEQKQKSKEGAYIDCMTKKNKYRPVLNKRAGDGCTSCAGGRNGNPQKNDRKIRTSGGAPAVRYSKSAKVGSTGGHKVRSSVSPKARSSGATSSVRSSGGPKMRPSGGANLRSPSGGHSVRSSASPKVRSGGRGSFRSFGGRRGR